MTTRRQGSADLPDFLIVGAAKAGTTSLSAYLAQHPEVYLSPIKEPGFFAFEGRQVAFRGPGDEGINRRTVTDLVSYRRLFAGAAGARAAGEASVVYLYDERAPERIHRRLPQVRLIAILRDPIERAYSSYLYLRRHGREPLASFEAALDAEAERIRDGWQHLWHYTRMGFHGRQLERYLRLFPREQIRVFLHERFIRDPQAVLRECFELLGVAPDFQADVTVRHAASGAPRSRWIDVLLRRAEPVKPVVRAILLDRPLRRITARLRAANLVRPPLPPRLRARLAELFHDDVRHLGALLGEDLSHWLAAPTEPRPAVSGRSR